MIPVDMDNIDRAALDGVIGTAEELTLDFKEDLPLSTREARKEFVADVVAFANTAGGDILIGVTERREDGERAGVASALRGVECNPDSFILTIENLLRDGIAPRITGLRTKPIEVADGRYVFVLRIPRSWSGPHLVTLGDSRFFGRNSRGKFALDVAQIRSAFASSEAQGERLRSFRDDRIGRVISRETPVPLDSFPTFLTHVVPADALSPHKTVDVREFEQYAERLAEGAKANSPLERYNLDGFCMSQGEPSARCYVQCFRSGIIEFGDAFYLPMRQPGYERSVNTQRFEEAVIRQVHAPSM